MSTDDTLRKELEWRQSFLEKEEEGRQRMLKTPEGRRYLICNAIRDVRNVIENLDNNVPEDTNRTRLVYDPNPNKIDSNERLRAELINQANMLLRMVVLVNDGGMSPHKVPSF